MNTISSGRHCPPIAVLGTGSIGMRHLQTLRDLDRRLPLAIPLRPSRRLRLRSAGFATAPDLRTAFRCGAHAAVIATETGRHLKDSLAALALGMDILVEKPLAVDRRQARALLEAATRSRRRVFVGCVLRHSESLSRFRKLLPRIGKLHAVSIECRSYLPDWRPQRPYRRSYSASAAQGGVLRDLIHEIDYAGWLFGWPQAVQGRLRNLGRLGIRAEEAAELSWQAPRGFGLQMGLDFLSRPARRRLTAFGKKGTLTWDGIKAETVLSLSGRPAARWRSRQSHAEMFARQARAFLAALRGRKDHGLATGEDGLRALAVCDAIRRSSASRREERVR